MIRGDVRRSRNKIYYDKAINMREREREREKREERREKREERREKR